VSKGYLYGNQSSTDIHTLLRKYYIDWWPWHRP